MATQYGSVYSDADLEKQTGQYAKTLEPGYAKQKQRLAESLAGTGGQYGSQGQYAYGDLAAQNQMAQDQYRGNMAMKGLDYGFQQGERLGTQDWQSGESALDRAARESEFGRSFGLEKAKTMMDATGNVWSQNPNTGEWEQGKDKTLMGQTTAASLAESLLKTGAYKNENDMAKKLGFPNVEAMQAYAAADPEGYANMLKARKTTTKVSSGQKYTGTGIKTGSGTDWGVDLGWLGRANPTNWDEYTSYDF